MSHRFRFALTRPPADSFAAGLTTVDLGAPDLGRAREQHRAYVEALESAGVEVTELATLPTFPDSTFVEDTAIIGERLVVLTRPGAASRAGEVEEIRSALASRLGELQAIEAPGTLDGGDVCDIDGHFLIGLSQRTNAEGAAQLSRHLATAGATSATIDIRSTPGILHLKSGLSWLGDGRLAVIEALADHPALSRWDLLVLDPAEAYAANAVRVNETLLVAAGFPRFAAELERLRYDVRQLEMSEFEKMDGGLTCLSLRF